jgi:hypothetical protein
VDAWLGELPAEVLPWKNLVKSPDKDELAAKVFEAYRNLGKRGAAIALAYARSSREIGLKLVSDGVARSADDVNTVMLTGFFHAYGPVNDFVVK